MKKILLFCLVLIMLFLVNSCTIRGIKNNNIINKNNQNTTALNNKLKNKNEIENKTNISLNIKNNEINNIEKVKEIYYQNKAIVLTYHHISDVPFSSITITPKRFESDIKMLNDKGFNVISMRKLVNAMNGQEKLPTNAVVISFDDGIESFYKYAYPVLKNYNMNAIVFVITSRVEAYSPSKDDFNPLSADKIREMYYDGFVDIQSHTHNSHDGVIINPEKKTGGKLAYKIYDTNRKIYESDENYEARVFGDLNKSSELIYKYTDVHPDMLCFPFGQYNERVINIAKKAGFKYFITTKPGVNKEDSKSDIIFRIGAGNSNLNSEQLFKNIINMANSK